MDEVKTLLYLTVIRLNLEVTDKFSDILHA